MLLFYYDQSIFKVNKCQIVFYKIHLKIKFCNEMNLLQSHKVFHNIIMSNYHKNYKDYYYYFNTCRCKHSNFTKPQTNLTLCHSTCPGNRLFHLDWARQTYTPNECTKLHLYRRRWTCLFLLYKLPSCRSNIRQPSPLKY